MNFDFLLLLLTFITVQIFFHQNNKAMKQQPDKGIKNTPSQPQPDTPQPGKAPATPGQQSPNKHDIPDDVPEREIKHTPANPQDKKRNK